MAWMRSSQLALHNSLYETPIEGGGQGLKLLEGRYRQAAQRSGQEDQAAKAMVSVAGQTSASK